MWDRGAVSGMGWIGGELNNTNTVLIMSQIKMRQPVWSESFLTGDLYLKCASRSKGRTYLQAGGDGDRDLGQFDCEQRGGKCLCCGDRALADTTQNQRNAEERMT